MSYSASYQTFSILLFCLIGCFCYGQKTEIKTNAYSGLFFFRGSGSTSHSIIGIRDDLGYYNFTSYGKRSGFSYSIETQVQRVTKLKHLLGLGVSYENLKSKAVVDSVYGDIGGFSATGNVIMTNAFVNINPYIGQRFMFGKIDFDALIGVDLSFSIKVSEKAKVTSFNETYEIQKAKHPTDIRPRIQLHAYYKHAGLLASYSLGLENLYSYDNPYYVNKKAYANFLRFGISYRL